MAECSSAEVGVGATMAPKSHLENGICADLVSAAKASIATGNRATDGIAENISSCEILVSSITSTLKSIAAMKPQPPKRFIQSALNEFVTASGVDE